MHGKSHWRSTLIICATDGQQTSYSLAQYANATGGYLAQLEHRYYGESLPFGNITSTLTYDWDYLTLDNVMMDSVQFVTELKTHTKTLENATVIVFGGMQEIEPRIDYSADPVQNRFIRRISYHNVASEPRRHIQWCSRFGIPIVPQWSDFSP